MRQIEKEVSVGRSEEDTWNDHQEDRVTVANR